MVASWTHALVDEVGKGDLGSATLERSQGGAERCRPWAAGQGHLCPWADSKAVLVWMGLGMGETGSRTKEVHKLLFKNILHNIVGGVLAAEVRVGYGDRRCKF